MKKSSANQLSKILSPEWNPLCTTNYYIISHLFRQPEKYTITLKYFRAKWFRFAHFGVKIIVFHFISLLFFPGKVIITMYYNIRFGLVIRSIKCTKGGTG